MRGPRLWLGAVLALFLLLPFVRTARSLNLFPDEAGFLQAGDGAVSLLLDGNLSPEAWRSDEWGSYGWMNPQLAKVIYGLAVRVGAPRQLYRDGGGRQKLNITTDVLWVARTPAVLFAFGSCVLMLLIGLRISPAVGVLAALTTAFNRFYRVQVSLALLEAPAAFFTLLAMLLLLKLHDALESPASFAHVLRRSAYLGLVLGLALSSKYLCGILLLFVLLSLAIAGLRGALQGKLGRDERRRLLTAAALVGSISAATFFLLSPQFYGGPIAQYRHTMRAWADLWQRQRLESDPELRMNGLTHAAEVTAGDLLLNTTSQAIADALIAHIPREGLRVLAHSYVTSAFNLESLCLLFVVAATVGHRWRIGWAQGWTDQELLLAWAALTFVLFIAWLPLAYSHYFMYPFLPTPLLIACGAVEGCRRLGARD